MTLRGVGLDIADVARFARLVESGGFAARWFTPEEMAECTDAADPIAAYALRFAAKEATWKAIAVRWRGPLPWRSIAVLGGPVAARVELSGEVARAAAAAGAGKITVALSIAGGLATAVAVVEERD